MAYPARLLLPDESVVCDLHPHWRRLVVPALALPIVVGIAAYVAAIIPRGGAQAALRWAVVVIAVLVVAVVSVRPALRWVTTHYVITTRRVVVRDGVLARHGRDVPLTRINDVSFSHTVLERLLRAGTLVVESAGERGQVVLKDVPKVEEVQRTVYDLVERVSPPRTPDPNNP